MSDVIFDDELPTTGWSLADAADYWAYNWPNDATPGNPEDQANPDYFTYDVAYFMCELHTQHGLSFVAEDIDDECFGLVIPGDKTLGQFMLQHKLPYNYLLYDDGPIIRATRRPVNDDLLIDRQLREADCIKNSKEQPGVRVQRYDPATLPREVEVHYMDPDRGLQFASQYGRLPGAPLNNARLSVTLDFVITADQARELAYDILARIWGQSLLLEFIHPDVTIGVASTFEIETTLGTFLGVVEESTITQSKSNLIRGSTLLRRRSLAPRGGRSISFAPANDNLENAFVLELDEAQTSNNTYATNQPDEPAHNDATALRSLWWSFVSDTEMLVEITASMDSPRTANIAVYIGTTMSDLVLVEADVSSVQFGAEVDVVYYIAVDGVDGATGDIEILAEQTSPINDDVANATTITAGQTLTGENRYATKESGEPDHAGDAGGRSLWWLFTATEDRTIEITVDSDFVALLAVYSGTGFGDFTEMGTDQGEACSVTFDAISGGTYYIAVDGYADTYGAISIACIDQGAPGGALPSGAVGLIDFANGSYLFEASPTDTEYTASEVIDQPSAIVTGLGLWTEENLYIAILAEFFDYLMTGEWTIVVKWCADEFATPLCVTDESDENPRFRVVDDPTQEMGAFDLVGGNERDAFDDPHTHGEWHASAITRTDDKLAVSNDEGAVVLVSSTQTGFAAGITNAVFGGFGRVLVQSLTIYPELDDSVLPALSVPEPNSPTNDDFADATVIESGDTLTGHNFGSTFESGEPNSPWGSDGKSVWYKFTAPSTGNFTVATTGSGIDDTLILITVYTGGPGIGALTMAEYNASPPYDQVEFAASIGVDYWFQIDGFGPVQGTITITVNPS